METYQDGMSETPAYFIDFELLLFFLFILFLYSVTYKKRKKNYAALESKWKLKIV